MKKILLTLIVSAIALGSSAQSTTATISHGGLSIGADAGLPLGGLSNVYSAALGGSLKYDAPISSTINITISMGYQAWLVKSALQLPGFKSDNFIPLKAGLKVYVSPGFFLEGQAGVAIHTRAGGDILFAYSPGIGYSFKNGFEIGARYEGFTKDVTFSQVAARIAFRF